MCIRDRLYADFVYGDVAECNVVDEYTVEFKLTKKSTPFLNNLAMSCLLYTSRCV